MSLTRTIKTPEQVVQLEALLRSRAIPFTVTIETGKPRTFSQNRLQRKWCAEVAEQMGDRTAEDVRGECKLTMGVPILRAENDEFRVAYDRVIRPLPYEFKLAAMMEPLDFPITRLMNADQKTRYLDHMARHWAQRGIQLTIPEVRQ